MLEILCEQLEHTPVDLQKLNKRFLQENEWYPAELGNATGKAGELHVVMAVEKIREENHSLRILSLNDKVSRGFYYFIPGSTTGYNIAVKNVRNDRDVDEVDLVVIQRDLPIIIETHLSRYRTGQSGMGVFDILDSDNVKRKKEHIARLLNSWPEIIFVIPKEYEEKVNLDGCRLHTFIRGGGHIVFFPYTRQEWKKTIEEFAHQQLRSKEEKTRQRVDTNCHYQCNPALSSSSLP